MQSLKRRLIFSGGTPRAVTFLAITSYKSGDKARAEKLFQDLKAKSEKEYVPPVCLFYVYLVRGDLD